MPGGVSAQSGGTTEPELSWVVVLYKREECSPEVLCGEGEALGSGKFNGVCYERYAKALNGMALTVRSTACCPSAAATRLKFLRTLSKSKRFMRVIDRFLMVALLR